MADSIAAVTGAAGGIGAAIAGALRADGWRVVALDRRFDIETADQIAVDVTDFAALSDVVDQIGAGMGPIGAIVNCAGITRDRMFHRIDPVADWQPVIDVNLTGPFNLCRAALPGMRAQGFGRIVNIASMNGLRGQPGQGNYSAAKAGLIGMTRTLALENASRGITANCVAPGFIETEMTRAIPDDIRDGEIAKIPAGRPGTPQEVAAVVRFLCSPGAGFITGETVSINGGQLMA